MNFVKLLKFYGIIRTFQGIQDTKLSLIRSVAKFRSSELSLRAMQRAASKCSK